MVRNKNPTMDYYKKYARLPNKEKQDLARAPHKDYIERLEASNNRTIWTERGLTLPDLNQTPIPDTVSARGWARYTSSPSNYHPDLVREFYAAMVPEVFRALNFVWVRGKRVEIKVDSVNEYLQTTPHPDLVNADGMPKHEFFEGTDGRLAAALRRNGTSEWDPGHVELNHSELHPDLALWTIFLKHSLRPSSHRTVISPEIANILFAIQNNLPFDVGRIIHSQILDTGCNSRGILAFPCLITYFCGRAGVEEASNEAVLEVPQSDIGRTAYNAFCSRHGIGTLPTGRIRLNRNRSRASAVRRELNEEERVEAVGPSSSLYEGNERSQPSWVPMIMDQFSEIRAAQRRLEAGQAQVLAGQARLEHYVSDLESQIERRFFGRCYSTTPRDQPD